ncbi:Crp/Fnr family transcriptional regulator [Paracoccus pacificus]|uniref:Crp/Fnr family transcriptional regulator n=1 Tax=Paracoccus pacificus TaxID=1463598 RepID=A0ABW4R8Y7_9RHOB
MNKQTLPKTLEKPAEDQPRAISDLLIKFLERRDVVTERDREKLKSLPVTRQSFGPGEVIIPKSRHVTRSCLMVSGMSARCHTVNRSNEETVITALHVPGDFVDLHGFLLAGLEHTVRSCGKSEVEFVDHSELRKVTESYPHLTRLLWLSTLIDAAIHRQWLVAAASLRSSAHLAHLISELHLRLKIVGLAENDKFQLPLLQRELAEVLGYSPIHINRAVRDLRDRGILLWSGFDITILKLGALHNLAQFNSEYLDLECIAR